MRKKLTCPNPQCTFHQIPGGKFIKHGYFRIRYNHQKMLRYRCQSCSKTFCAHTFQNTYRQKKPFLNLVILSLLCSGQSLRSIARHLNVSYKTVYLKFLWLMQYCPNDLKINADTSEVFIDELESIEHTKCKPVTIGIIVSKDYRLLATSVGTIPAKGKLAKVSREKYGMRTDQRSDVIENILQKVKLYSIMKINSDGHPLYPKLIKEHLPQAEHEVFIREEKEKLRDRLHEKKQKKKFDPLFAVNQKCARLRSDIKRLVRRSWCTTKKIENLEGHLKLYLWAQKLGYV